MLHEREKNSDQRLDKRFVVVAYIYLAFLSSAEEKFFFPSSFRSLLLSARNLDISFINFIRHSVFLERGRKCLAGVKKIQFFIA
jgi:hypothetical protein